MLNNNSPVQQEIAVQVTESYYPLIVIAGLLGAAIAILFGSFRKQKRHKYGIFAAIPILLAFVVLARFPIYSVGVNSAIAIALITPIAAYIFQLLRPSSGAGGGGGGGGGGDGGGQ